MRSAAEGYRQGPVWGTRGILSTACNLEHPISIQVGDHWNVSMTPGVHRVMTALFRLQPLLASEDSRAVRHLPATVLPIVAVLRQLADVIRTLTDEQYRSKPVGAVSSNVGSHVRHCLDHVEALLASLEEGELSYDRRQRGTEVETNREAALEVIRRQERQLLAFRSHAERRPLRLSAMVSSGLPPTVVETTVGRELAFVLSHTVHHNALIAVMAQTLGIPVPERFGYAPSTIAHLEKAGCAR
jgi:uncharacterized damage-inducible protein DinB